MIILKLKTSRHSTVINLMLNVGKIEIFKLRVIVYFVIHIFASKYLTQKYTRREQIVQMQH